MKIIVMGATGGTGRAVVEELLARGHEVTAFARRPDALETSNPRLARFAGDVMNPANVGRAVRGHDAVVVALGIRENPLLVRLRGSTGTAMNVRSAGTRNVVAAMREHGVRRLVVMSTYGVGETRDRLSLKWRLIFSLLLKPQIADTEVQEEIVRNSGLDWVIAQPVGLTDDAGEASPFLSTEGEARHMNVSRHAVARFLAEAAERPTHVSQSVAVSAA
jgi:nucleoside-diphosphate-sugar epimerase